MDTLMLLMGIVVLVAVLLFRPPRTQIVYVPVEPVDPMPVAELNGWRRGDRMHRVVETPVD